VSPQSHNSELPGQQKHTAEVRQKVRQEPLKDYLHIRDDAKNGADFKTSPS